MRSLSDKYAALFIASAVGGLVGGVVIYLTLVPGLNRSMTERQKNWGDDPGASVASASERLLKREVHGELRLPSIGPNDHAGESAIIDVGEPQNRLPISDSQMQEIIAEAQAATREALGATEREAALTLAYEQLRAPHRDTRRNGIRWLRKLFAAQAGGKVLPALHDSSATVRREAATYFEHFWDPNALGPLVELVYGDNPSVAEHALDALCKSGQGEAIAEVEEYYLNGSRLEVAYEAGKALYENNYRSSLSNGLQRFYAALNSDKATDRRMGVAGLGRWGSVDVHATSIQALATDSSSRVRKQVSRTLASWGLDSRN